MRNDYFEYLCGVSNGRQKYAMLLGQLHEMEFTWFVPNDDNRLADGARLREYFLDYEKTPTSVYEFPWCRCTVLEMLIGLAIRLEWDCGGLRVSPSVPECFWILVENLGLIHATNRMYEVSEIAIEVEEKVKNMVERKYSKDGKGGLFPLDRSRGREKLPEPSEKILKKDQREVEIWYQKEVWRLQNDVAIYGFR